MYKVDLNCDLGESFGSYRIGMDELIIPYISSANVACGFHAADPVVMSKTVASCKGHHVMIGAHPGLPDLMGFGRRNMDITPLEAKTMVQYQIGAIMAFCKSQGVSLQHVKPHGALYNMAGKDYTLAKAICEGVKEVEPELIMLVLAGSQMQRAASDLELRMAKEVFADRAYEEDGSLVARSKPGAMIEDENVVIERVLKMILEGKVTTLTGKEIPIQADSVCVHGDGEKALMFVRRLTEVLEDHKIRICNLSEILYKVK